MPADRAGATLAPVAGVLAVEDLARSFGDLAVLRGASFAVRPGRILGFLGRNGAGKTTTMRCIFGLLDPDAGRVVYRGQPLTRATRRAFGYMPEERGLYPKMSVQSQLVHFGRLAGLDRRQATSAALLWLERLGLADRRRETLEKLSHGNQQRVQLAAALVHDPEVLVLDEPVSGLDPVGVGEMGDILRRAAADGATILFSSHQLDLVEELCADVAIINDGRIAAHGDLEQFRARSPYRRLEVSVNGRAWIPEGVDLTHVGGEHPHLLVPATVPAADLLGAAQASGVVTAFRYEPPSLSDLFHEAVDAAPTRHVAPAGVGGVPAVVAENAARPDPRPGPHADRWPHG
jgi:ABC-2 type transport system ATP-binding protein